MEKPRGCEPIVVFSLPTTLHRPLPHNPSGRSTETSSRTHVVKSWSCVVSKEPRLSRVLSRDHGEATSTRAKHECEWNDKSLDGESKDPRTLPHPWIQKSVGRRIWRAHDDTRLASSISATISGSLNRCTSETTWKCQNINTRIGCFFFSFFLPVIEIKPRARFFFYFL